MCYDVSFSTTIESIHDYFPDLVVEGQIAIDYETTIHIMGHAYGLHPIIYPNLETGKLHLKLMEWGCIPFYTKDEDAFLKQRAFMLNARSERILDDSKSYWYKIRQRRCLIPMSAIYEHRKIRGWKKKVPYLVKMKGEKMFFLPGLYSVAELPDKNTGEMIKRFTYTLVTRSANTVMKLIHNDGPEEGRMPLFLPLELAKDWVNPEFKMEELGSILDYKIEDESLEYWPVYTIRSPKQRPDEKRKDEFWEWPTLPALEEVQTD
jgi:putative SOS response-associated peptidase YedK